MDKTQADAIITAMLEPDLMIQQEIQRKREREAGQLGVQRRRAGFVLAGFAAGIAIGYPMGGFDSRHGLMGMAAGLLAGAMVERMRKRRMDRARVDSLFFS